MIAPRSSISFVLDGRKVTVEFQRATGLRPTSTVLQYLRSLPTHKGVKEGCAEGDCGACTVVLAEPTHEGTLRYRAVDSCLVFLPMIHGKQLITVENLRNRSGELHPVQAALVQLYGSQCGYCTPGIVMSMFALYKTSQAPTTDDIEDALTGNLCRCTGYRPIVDAARQACTRSGLDHFSKEEQDVLSLLQEMSADSVAIETPDQRYFKPSSLQEALSLKRELPEAIIISGATDVALRVTKGHETLREIIDVSGIEELRMITDEDSSMFIGASTVLNDVALRVKEDFPALGEMLRWFGSQQIRNLATLGGNLGTASPIGDTLPVLMAYEARVVLGNLEARREVPISSFLKGYRVTDRRPDELILGVLIPKPPAGVYVWSHKVSRRKDLDISTVSAGFRLSLDQADVVRAIVLAYGGMAEYVKRAARTEQFLLGKPWSRENAQGAMAFIEEDFVPISDVRGSADFRRISARNLLLKCWSETRTSYHPG